MKIVIISGGKPPSKFLIEEEMKNSNYTICCDSGANCMYDYNLHMDLLLGDFDSINKDVYDFYSNSDCKIEKFPVKKDYTDTELAIYKAIELGCKEICLLGCTGNRVDHVLGNLGLLLKCLKNNIRAYIKDDNNFIFLSDRPVSIHGKKGDLFSLQSFGDLVEDLTIEGAKYPLTNYKLIIGDPRTISNVFEQDVVHLSFTKGTLLVNQCKD